MAEILICDDEEEITKLMAEWLETLGHTATALNKPKQIKPTLLSRPFDLVIVDQNMPVMTGKEVLEEVRQIFSPAELPVVFLTGHSEKDLVMQVAKIGVSGFFVKPLKFDVMEAKLPTLMPRRFNIKEVRGMMEKCQVPDRTLSQLPGLSAYMGRPSSLFSVAFDEGKYILAAGDTITSMRQQQKLNDGEVYIGVTVYTQNAGKWVRVFPTIWQKR
jgi:DNA-binding response OmpR family regulator